MSETTKRGAGGAWGRAGVALVLGWAALAVLFARPAAAESVLIDFETLSGPSWFTGAKPPVTLRETTVSGGQILTAVSGLLADRTTVYGTAGFMCPGCKPVLTIEVAEPVAELSFTLMNGTIYDLPYLIQDNVGHRKTVWIKSVGAGGAARIRLAGGNIRKVTVRMAYDLGALFRFYIDDIGYEVPDLGFTVSVGAFVPSNAVQGGPTVACALPEDEDEASHDWPGKSGRSGPPAFARAWERAHGRPFHDGFEDADDDDDDDGRVPLYFAGDDRGFVADSPRFRARQSVTLFPDRLANPAGYAPDSIVNRVGEFRAYAEDAVLADGRIGPEDEDGVAGDCHLFNGAELPETDLMDVTVTRIDDTTVAARLRGTVETPIAGQASVLGAIDWDITVTLHKQGRQVSWTVGGLHDGFPAFEIYVNGKPVYAADTGPQPYGFADTVRKLLPPMDVTMATASGVLP